MSQSSNRESGPGGDAIAPFVEIAYGPKPPRPRGPRRDFTPAVVVAVVVAAVTVGLWCEANQPRGKISSENTSIAESARPFTDHMQIPGVTPRNNYTIQ